MPQIDCQVQADPAASVARYGSGEMEERHSFERYGSVYERRSPSPRHGDIDLQGFVQQLHEIAASIASVALNQQENTRQVIALGDRITDLQAQTVDQLDAFRVDYTKEFQDMKDTEEHR